MVDLESPEGWKYPKFLCNGRVIWFSKQVRLAWNRDPIMPAHVRFYRKLGPLTIAVYH